MKVVCPSCAAAYNIDDQRVPASGLKVRCPKCKHTFPVWRPGTEPAAVVPLPGPGPAATSPDAVPLPPPPFAAAAPAPSSEADPFARAAAVALPPPPGAATPLPQRPATWPPPPRPPETAAVSLPPPLPAPSPVGATIPLPQPGTSIPLPPPLAAAAPPGAVPLPSPGAVPLPGFVMPQNHFGEAGARPPRTPPPLPVQDEVSIDEEVPFADAEPDPEAAPEVGDESPFAAGPLPVALESASPADPFSALADPFAAASAPQPAPRQEPLPSAPEPLGFGEITMDAPRSARGGADPFSRPVSADIFEELAAPAPRPTPAAPSVRAEELESLLGGDAPPAAPPSAAPTGAGYKVRRRSGKVFGPFPGDQVVDMLGKGELLGNEDVTDDGGATWAPIGTVAAFAEAMRALTATPEELAAPAAGRAPVAPAEGIPFGDRMAAARVTESEPPKPSPMAALAGISRRTKLVAAAAVAALVLAVGGGGALTRYGWFFHKALRGGSGAAQAIALVARAKAALAVDDFASRRDAAAAAGQAAQADDLSPQALALAAVTADALDRVHSAGPDLVTRARLAATQVAAISRADGEPYTLLALAAVAGLEGGDGTAAEGALERARWSGAPEPEALALMGARALERGDAGRAAKLYQQLEATEPNTARAAIGLGRAAALAGDLEKARAELDKALARSAGHPTARLELAALAERRGAWDEARAKVDELLAPAMDGKLAARERARALALSAGLYGRHAADANKAEEAFQAAIAADPKLPEARQALAAFHLRRGDPARAITALEPLQAGAAANPAVAELLIRALAGSGRALDATNLAEAALARRPDDARLLVARAAARELAGEREPAAALYRKVLERAPDLAAPRVALARMALDAQQIDKAAEELAPVVEKSPQDAAVQSALGDLRRAQGRPDEARQAYQLALKIDPEFAPADFGLARLAMAAGDVAAARESLTRALAVEPRNARSHVELGTLLWQAGDLAAAERSLVTAVTLAPNDAVAHVRLGAVRLERGDAVAGSKEIEAGSNMAPDLAEGHHWLGRTLLARGEAPGALAQLKRSVDMSPGNATYLMHLAVAQERTSMLMDAVETYQKAIAADPNLLEAQERFGLLYAGNDRCDLASPIFEKALKLAPTLSRLKLDLADCRLRTRRPAEAVRLYQEVADADPKQPGVHYRLARAVHETKGMGTALPYYEKAAAAEKDNPMPFLYLGYAYKERGAKAKAVQAFKSYLSIKADAEDRADIVREIEDLGGTP